MDKPDPLKRNNVNVLGNREAARTMLFVHGFGTDQSAWNNVVPAFTADYRVVLLDNVGAGTTAPEAFVQHRYLNLHRYAQDLLEVCAALDLEEIVAVGHSVGAMISLLAAIKAPGRFSRLVLIGASPRYLDTEGYRGGLAKEDIDTIYKGVLSNYDAWAETYGRAAMANADQAEFTRHFIDSLRKIPEERALTVLCAILQSDHRDDVAKLDKPALIIQTKHDTVVPMEVAEYLHRRIKDSCLTVIDAEGHLPHISAPNLVIEAMRAFL